MPVPVPQSPSPPRIDPKAMSKRGTRSSARNEGALPTPDSYTEASGPKGGALANGNGLGHFANGHANGDATRPINGVVGVNGVISRKAHRKQKSGDGVSSVANGTTRPDRESSRESSNVDIASVLLSQTTPVTDERTADKLMQDFKNVAQKEHVEKIDWEIPRKAFHSSIGFLVMYLYSTEPVSTQPIVYALCGSLFIIVPADIIRFKSPGFAKAWEALCGPLMRESEKHKWNGVIWYIIGVVYSLALLPRDVAVVSILVLSWCDTAASTFGRMYGRYTKPLPPRFLGLPLAKRKSLAGSIAAVITGSLIAAGFWGLAVPKWQGYSPANAALWGKVLWKWKEAAGTAIVQNGSWWSLFAVSAATGLIAGVTEALDLGSIDDNVSLPIITGTLLYGLSKAISYFLG